MDQTDNGTLNQLAITLSEETEAGRPLRSHYQTLGQRGGGWHVQTLTGLPAGTRIAHAWITEANCANGEPHIGAALALPQ